MKFPLKDEPFKFMRGISSEDSVEVEFHIRMDDGSILAGRMDGIIEWDDRIYVMENKTRWSLGSNLVEQFKPNAQIDTYAYACAKLVGRCDGVLVNVLQVAKTKEDFLRHITHRSEKELLAFEKMYLDVVKDLESSRTANRYTQDGFYNGACMDFNTVCVYRDVCLYGERVIDVDRKFKRKAREGEGRSVPSSPGTGGDSTQGA